MLAAAWQPFPAWVALAYNALRALFPSGRSDSGDATTRAALRWVRRAYIGTGALCALAHLAVLLAVALRRARVIPLWAAWSMAASSPLLISAFALPNRVGGVGLGVAAASVVLLIIGSLPAARAMAAARTAEA